MFNFIFFNLKIVTRAILRLIIEISILAENIEISIFNIKNIEISILAELGFSLKFHGNHIGNSLACHWDFNLRSCLEHNTCTT